MDGTSLALAGGKTRNGNKGKEKKLIGATSMAREHSGMRYGPFDKKAAFAQHRVRHVGQFVIHGGWLAGYFIATALYCLARDGCYS